MPQSQSYLLGFFFFAAAIARFAAVAAAFAAGTIRTAVTLRAAAALHFVFHIIYIK